MFMLDSAEFLKLLKLVIRTYGGTSATRECWREGR